MTTYTRKAIKQETATAIKEVIVPILREEFLQLDYKFFGGGENEL